MTRATKIDLEAMISLQGKPHKLSYCCYCCYFVAAIAAIADPRRITLKENSVLHHCHDIHPMELRTMSLQCPLCNSPKIASLQTAMKIGAAVGTVGGAARGASAALAAGQVGASVGAIAGPLGITLGTVSGAILGGLAGGAGGCALGAQLGEKLDRHVLANNLCLACNHRFNLPA